MFVGVFFFFFFFGGGTTTIQSNSFWILLGCFVLCVPFSRNALGGE